MRRATWVVVLAPALLLMDCSTVPVTGRKQLSLIPRSEMLGMSSAQYGEFLKEHPPTANQEQTALVRRVGTRIQKAVEQYFAGKGLSAQLDGYKWEFNVVDSKEVNAWCMPGGKVVVYTGILPITKTEAGLATVMGHEIAHAIAEHGNERMSQELLAQLGGMGLQMAMEKKPKETQDLWMTVYGVGAQFGALLPYSRLHETEADDLGLIFMAIAGYDPAEAISFWERMAAGKQGQAPPEFMSTHPSDQTRINNLKSKLPNAKTYYKGPQ